MKKPPRLKQLSQLNELRERDVERLGAELAGKTATRERYLRNLARLEQLCIGSGASGAQFPSGPAPAGSALVPSGSAPSASTLSGSALSGSTLSASALPGSARALSPALSLNCGGYKQGVMQLAQAHRQELALHESDLAHTRRRVIDAARRQQGLGQVLERERRALQRADTLRDQKRVDELASQVWLRGRA